MTKDLKELAQSGCPWFCRSTVAGHAGEAVVWLLAPQLGFACREIRPAFHGSSGCALAVESVTDPSQATSEGKFLGAILGKLAHRGLPAPCSLAVERHVLREAKEVRVLNFKESSQSGEIRFSCSFQLRDLKHLLRASLTPELLIDEPDVEALLHLHGSLCTHAEKDLFDQLIQALPERRLGLLWLSQRPLDSMADLLGSPLLSSADRVDFALEIPGPSPSKWLKVALELDDDSHTGTQLHQDRERDRCLKAAGWQVCRLHVGRQSEWGFQLQALARQLGKALPEETLRAAQQLRALPAEQRRAVQNLVLLPIAEAQILAALSQLLYRGCKKHLTVADPQGHGLGLVVRAVNELVQELCRLHDIRVQPELHPAAGPGEDADLLYFARPDPRAWDAIRATGPGVITPRPVREGYVQPLLSAAPQPVETPSADRVESVRSSLRHLLQNVFRKKEFREGQLEILGRALTLKPVVGLLPTGAGKSLCFQLASLVQPGFALVVDPLRSLMIDQRENLEALGIHRCLAIMSGLEPTEIRDQAAREEGYRSVENGHYWFVFIAPERLQMPGFRKHVHSFASAVPIPYCVVDEAHCVSEWGHDFRPAYLNIGRLVREYCKFQGQQPCVMALTGTASRNVLIDIMRELDINDQEAIIEPRSFDRKELTFEVCQVKALGRLPQVVGKLRSILAESGWQPGQPGELPSGLVYTNFATASYVGVKPIADELVGHLNLPVEIYSGTKPYGLPHSQNEWARMKLQIQRRFKLDQSPVLVCTHSFGMGIDKPNIRFTIHTMLPRSLEDFYQQAGRAGRDRSQARCIIFFSDDQPGLANELLDTEKTPLEEIARKAARVSKKGQGDAIRNTWFLTQSFLGREIEKSIVRHVVTQILQPRLATHAGDICTLDVSFAELPCSLFQTKDDKGVKADAKTTALEKALYRLLVVGAIADYMKDYQRRQFVIEFPTTETHQIYLQLESYLRRYATEYELGIYLPSRRSGSWAEAACDCAAGLIDYIYATIEKRRRRAIAQMLQTARDAAREGKAAASNQRFREQLLAYLEESEFTKPVATLAAHIRPAEWFELLSQVQGTDGITKLLGACRRKLEESPSHPGLLLLAGLCRTASPNPQQGTQDVSSAFIVLSRHYPNPSERVKIAQQALEHVRRLVPSQADAVLVAILQGDPSGVMARHCYENARPFGEAHELAIRHLAHELIIQLDRRSKPDERPRPTDSSPSGRRSGAATRRGTGPRKDEHVGGRRGHRAVKSRPGHDGTNQ